MRRRLTPVLLALATALALAAATTAAASGSYTITACSPTSSPGAWSQVNTSPTGMTSGNQCGGPMIGPTGGGDAGSLFGEDLVGSSSTVPSGDQAGWELTAPVGSTITAVSYYRSLTTGNAAASWEAGLFAANGAPLDICVTDPDPCSSLNNQVPVTITGLNTSGLFFGVECAAPTSQACIPGATLHYAQAEMYSVTVTLADTALPSVSALDGALWGGGVVWGTVPVTFSASDVSGIEQVAVDGMPGQVALAPQSCDYMQTQPCPQLPSGSVGVDTSLLHDGAQTVSLVVTDAAGNTQTVQSPTMVVDNNGPPAPTALGAAAIAGNDKAIQLTWSDPSAPPQPVTGADAQLCQASCAAPVAVSAGGSAQVAVAGPGSYGVRLWLTDSAGRGGPSNAAIANVTVPAPGTTGPTGPSGPSGPTGHDGSAHPAALRLSHTLKGRHLTVNIALPKGAVGPVTVTLGAFRGKRCVSLVRRRVAVKRGHATLRLVLAAGDLSASHLNITASAKGARTTTIVLHHLR